MKSAIIEKEKRVISIIIILFAIEPITIGARRNEVLFKGLIKESFKLMTTF